MGRKFGSVTACTAAVQGTTSTLWPSSHDPHTLPRSQLLFLAVGGTRNRSAPSPVQGLS